MATPSGLTNSELIKYLGLPADTITKLQSPASSVYTAAKNSFLDAVYNKILYSEVTGFAFTNPFKKYDGYPINYGDTVEQLFVELPKGYAFDADAEDPFKKSKPSVKALYSSINLEQQYCTTVQDSLLRRAVLNEYGFMNLIDSIIASLGKSMTLDEYDAQRAVFGSADIYAKGVEEYETGSTLSETGANIVRTIMDAVTYMTLPNKECNKSGVLTASRKSDLLLVIKADILTSLNVDFLSGVYNLGKVSMLPEENIIPVASFQTEDADGTLHGEDIDFALIDSSGMDNHVALQDSTFIYNPKGMYTNHFTNLWKLTSFKLFCNARAFKAKVQA